MRFPRTIEEMSQRGYKYQNDSECKGCGAAIEWWETPNGRKIPMDQNTAQPHWQTCPQADLFRKDR